MSPMKFHRQLLICSFLTITLINPAYTDVGITGGRKGNNMLYLSGIQTQKVLTSDLISKVVEEVEKKASELENNLKWYQKTPLKNWLINTPF